MLIMFVPIWIHLDARGFKFAQNLSPWTLFDSLLASQGCGRERDFVISILSRPTWVGPGKILKIIAMAVPGGPSGKSEARRLLVELTHVAQAVAARRSDVLDLLASELVVGVDAARSFRAGNYCTVDGDDLARVDELRGGSRCAIYRRDAVRDARGSEDCVQAPRQC